MIVIITELATGNVVAKVPVVFRNLDGTSIGADEYFREAWSSAIEDGRVKHDALEDYTFSMFEGQKR